MTPSIIFVETSIQVQRVLAPRSKQNQIEAQIAKLASNLYTSHYVWMEFQRTVVADYAYVRRLMLQHGGWGDTMVHLLSGQRAFRPRAAIRCTELLGLLYNDSRADWHYALRLIDQMLQRRLQTLFWTHITALADPILCDLVAVGVTHQTNGNYTVADKCRKATALCHLPDFLSKHRSELRVIADYLATHPRGIKDQTRVMRLLSTVLTDPRAALGQTNCWPLGDVIIALQVPSNTALWTLDADFKPLAAALGLKLYTPEINT